MLLPGVTGLGDTGSGEAIPREVFGVELEHLCESHLNPHLVLLLVCQELLLL